MVNTKLIVIQFNRIFGYCENAARWL